LEGFKKGVKFGRRGGDGGRKIFLDVEFWGF
jgi:hypothetical protein